MVPTWTLPAADELGHHALKRGRPRHGSRHSLRGWRGGYRPSSCHGIVASDGPRPLHDARWLDGPRSRCCLHRLRLAPLLEPATGLDLTRQCRQPHSLDLIDAAPAVREPVDVDEARTRLDVDHAEMIEQFHRWRDGRPSDVMIELKFGEAHARAGAVADGPLYRSQHRRARRGSI
jgi:hypothetical protein